MKILSFNVQGIGEKKIAEENYRGIGGGGNVCARNKIR